MNLFLPPQIDLHDELTHSAALYLYEGHLNIIVQTVNAVRSKSLKHRRLLPSGCKYIGIRKVKL